LALIPDRLLLFARIAHQEGIELMRSGQSLWAGIRANPAETKWKRPLRHIAHQKVRNGVSFLLLLTM
jgi:hypothetical protein